MMKLEDYFNFFAPHDIRLKGGWELKLSFMILFINLKLLNKFSKLIRL